jgi:hypothetical protein
MERKRAADGTPHCGATPATTMAHRDAVTLYGVTNAMHLMRRPPGAVTADVLAPDQERRDLNEKYRVSLGGLPGTCRRLKPLATSD